MAQEDKNLLLRYLCMALPYGVILNVRLWDEENTNARLTGIDEDGNLTADVPADCVFSVDDVKPYLRPLKDMTDEEYKSVEKEFLFYGGSLCSFHDMITSSKVVCWLNAHHFDYRGLIPKGLAIEVTEDNNPYK